MQVYIFTVRIPEHVWDEREVTLVGTKTNDVLLWTVAELNKYYSGEFTWKKINRSFGICALQYINRGLVRIIINAPTQQQAFEMVKSYSWHLDAKKFHKRTYAPRQPKGISASP
jgi:hypothetical protein